MSSRRAISRDDILDVEVYAAQRKQRRAEMIAMKRNRRMAVGPNATFHFENFDTMLYQVHEMLYTERGGEEQIADELAAYNPLIPQGNELVATMMLEVEDPAERERFLARLGGVADTIWLEVDGQRTKAEPEHDVERDREDGKTSSVHFLHFRMTPEQADAFRRPDSRVVLAIEHPNYGHMAIMPPNVKAEVAKDL